MSHVYLCIPSARPAPEAQACIDKWRAQGYRTAIWRDFGAEPVDCDYLVMQPYPGYAMACNSLIKDVLAMDPECAWVVLGGDDTDPDPNKRADEIAAELMEHFCGPRIVTTTVISDEQREDWYQKATFGVVQPTGDRFCGGSIDRIAGSPWIGRSFCERMYGGRGPLWHEYFHCFEDEELKEVAEKLGVYWMRPDLTHLHHHFQRASDAIDSGTVNRPVPPHLVQACSAAHWSRFQAMFLGRKAQNFPGHEPVGTVLMA